MNLGQLANWAGAAPEDLQDVDGAFDRVTLSKAKAGRGCRGFSDMFM